MIGGGKGTGPRPGEVWRRFYKERSREARNDSHSNWIEFIDFCCFNFDEILADAQLGRGRKLRLSVPFDLPPGRRAIRETMHALSLGDRVIVSTGQFVACGASRTRAFYKLGTMGSFASGFNSDLRFPHGFEFESWLSEAEPLLSSGLVTYLPLKGPLVWENGFLGILPNPLETYDHEWQLGEFARDMDVSEKLGAATIFPRAGEVPVAARSPGGAAFSAYIAARLCVPMPSGISTDLFMKIREDHADDFDAISRALEAAICKLGDLPEEAPDLESAIYGIQKDLIDVPLRDVSRRLDRLRRMRTLRLAGMTVTAAPVAAAAFLLPAQAAALIAGAAGAVNGAHILKIFLDDLENRREALFAKGNVYLNRLMLGK